VLILCLLLVISPAYAAVGQEKLPLETLSWKFHGVQDWTDMHKRVFPGEELRFTVTDAIIYKRGGSLIGPEGHSDYADDTFPCPTLPKYALVGKLGEEGKCFLVGAELTLFPEEDAYLFLGINDDDLSDNENLFTIRVEITRPKCGDDVCAESEIGSCEADCSWCGDYKCSAGETCGNCHEDCGICPEEETNIINVVTSYYDFLETKDFEEISKIISGDIEDYFSEMKRFKREFDKISKFVKVDDSEKFLPELTYPELELEVGDLRPDSARVKATYSDGVEEVKVKKINSKWKVTDTHNAVTWLSERYDLNDLRQDHNDYLDSLVPEYVEDKPFPWNYIVVPLVVVFIILGLLIGFRELKKRKPHKKAAPKKETKPVKTKECSKCKTKLFHHEKFCVKCGKKV